MSELMYLPEVRCEVSEGLRDTEVTVCVRDENDFRQFMQVTRSMVNLHGETSYLPVGIIQVDRKARRVLIELPTEADSGVNRMWMPFDSFLVEQEAEQLA
jgi:hypothetical protein